MLKAHFGGPFLFVARFSGFLVLRYLTPLWAESKLSRPLIAL